MVPRRNDIRTSFGSRSPAAVINGVKLVSSVTNFNGNDALTLEKNGVVIDAIGQVGFNPGAAWTDTTVTTLNATIRRKTSINRGSIPPAAPGIWSLALEWDVYAVDTFNGLGLR